MVYDAYSAIQNIRQYYRGSCYSFVDITQIIEMRQTLTKANKELSRMAIVVRDANDAISVQDLDGNILAWNPMATKLYGWSEAEAVELNINDRIPKEKKEEELEILQKLGKHEIMEPYKTKRKTKSGASLDIFLTATALVNEDGELYAISTIERKV